MNRKLAICAALGTLALGAQTARANTINLANVSNVPSGGGVDWTYNVNFDNSRTAAGTHFTIVDFGPATLVTGPTAGGAGNWSFSQPLVGGAGDILVLSTIGQIDDPTIPNATFTWTGATGVLLDPAGPGSVDNNIVLHTLLLGSAGGIAYATEDTSQASPFRLSRATGPLAGPSPVSTPDGGMTAMLLGIGFIGAAGIRRKLS